MKAFNNRLVILQEELTSGQRHPDHEVQYAKYFDVKSTPVRGLQIIAKEEALAQRNFGYFALVSNEIKEAVKALEIYQNKDLLKKPLIIQMALYTKLGVTLPASLL